MPIERVDPSLGAAVRRLRERAGIAQEALAHDAGITTGTLSKIERGKANPSWSTVGRIARALGVTVAALAAETER